MDPDHFFDLVPLMYAYRFQYRRETPTPLLLPPGGIEVLQRLAEALDSEGRFTLEAFDPEEYDPEVALQIGPLILTFARTQHYIEGYAVRFTEDRGNMLCFSSDTGPAESVKRLAAGCDLLLAEATLLAQPAHETLGRHLTGTAAGEFAASAGARRLLLTHSAESCGDWLLADARKSFGGPIELAQEGRAYEI
jgi:ribonuclease BN (tRNA processing enzyme)